MFGRKCAIAVMLVVSCLMIGCPPPPSGLTVPDVCGETEAAAAAALVGAQLAVGTVTTAASVSVPLGCVISQAPAAGASVAAGAAVALVVSTGPAPELAWTYTPAVSSIWGLDIHQTLDGGFIVGGGYNSSYNMYALKLSSHGSWAWDATYTNLTPDSNQSELWRHEARGIRETPDGGHILLGSGHMYQDGLPDRSFVLVKTDAGGEIEWSVAYAPENPYDPGEYCAVNYAAALDLTDDGGYMVTGSSYVGQYYLASILKTDADGNVEFHTVVNDNARAYDQQVTGAQQTLDGGYVLTGYSDNGAPHGCMALLIKLDAAGELEWSKTYQYPADNHGAEAFALTQTADGGYVIGGELINDITKAATYGCWICRVDANGDIVWNRAYGHALTLHYPKDFAETPDGDIVAGGALSDGTMALAKFTSTGDLLWNFGFDTLPNATVNALDLTTDGGCVAVGSGISGGTHVAKVDYVYVAD